MLDEPGRALRAWSVTALGLVFLVVASTQAYIDAEAVGADVVEVSLPIVTGLAVVVGGATLRRTEPASVVARIAAWGVGGVVVGEAVILWFSFIVSLEQSALGEPVVMHLNSTAIAMGGALLLGQSATKNARARTRLREANRQLEAVMGTVEACIFIKDVDGRYQLMNEECREVLGLTEAEIVGKTDFDIFPEGLASQFRADDERVLETGETVRVEETVPTMSGERTHLTLKSPLKDDDGEPVGVCAVATDISERKARERELDARSAAIEASIDGIAILNDDGEYVYVNDAHADVYGYDDPDAFIGETWHMCYEEAELARFEEAVMPTLWETGGWLGEATGLRRDGSTFPQELSLSTLDDGGLVCVVRDVSERLQYREELERQNARLEEFASVLSHDLRNPLSVAGGQLELAREETESESLEEVAWAIDRMDELIDDVLTLARQGERVGETEPVALDALSEECWRNVETGAGTLDVETDAVIRADRSRLKQLVENLLRNAVEHGSTAAETQSSASGDTASNGGASVEQADAGVNVRIGRCEDGFFVEDDGVGIPASDVDAVFERGYTTAATGTGFGLAIASTIADAHDWTIAAVEHEDAGARFEITGVEWASD